MLKITKTFITILLLLPVLSCGTINIRNHYYEDAKSLSSENIAILAYDDTITVKKVNGKKVNWNRTLGDKVIYLPQGKYSFQVRYGAYYFENDRSIWRYSDITDLNTVILEGGKQYRLYGILTQKEGFSFSIIESKIPLDNKNSISFFP